MLKNKFTRIAIGIIFIVLGWLSLGIGYTIKSNYNGLIFYSGFALILFGILVLLIKKRKKNASR